ncbi:MAG: sulfite exporter TauE/SafE family protein [Deltaproteobacteria bacterium]|nr:sulfite exporter TauE/SafE family protein [Deltaproteobacteria bacterium]
MDSQEFSLLLALGGAAAGLVGSLTGLGGGIVIVPFLALGLGVDLRYAIGTSLITIIATSSGAAAAYVKEGYTNFRIGMFLEIATTVGAMLGAYLAVMVSTSALAALFGAVLFYSAYLSNRPRPERPETALPDRLATVLKMDSSYPTADGPRSYRVSNIPGGFALMFIAGGLSGLLGIGSGAVKVLAMDQVMRIPFKVSTTTSTFMIGVTAAASAGVYLGRGYIDPVLAMPVMLGVLAGSMLGAKALARAETRILRIVFSLVILGLGAELIYNGLTGRI